jgi:hypothetical protein
MAQNRAKWLRLRNLRNFTDGIGGGDQCTALRTLRYTARGRNSVALLCASKLPMEPSKMEMAFRHVVQWRQIADCSAPTRARRKTGPDGARSDRSQTTLAVFARTLDLFEDDLRKILADE